MPHRPAVTRTLALTAFMSSAALAEDNILDPISGALDGANNVMMTVDSTIAMLAKAIDLLTMVPVIGPFAQMLKPIVNTYMDIKTTIMPIIDAGNRGMAYVKQINEARNTVRQMFSNSNFSDRVNSINSLVGQFGGLSSLSGNARTIDPNDPRGSVARISRAETDAYFAKRPRNSQIGAWASPQSQPVPDRTALEASFAECARRFEAAPLTAPPHWGGLRLRPREIELWQGRQSRMHDRLRYVCDGGVWRMDRLAP